MRGTLLTITELVHVDFAKEHAVPTCKMDLSAENFTDNFPSYDFVPRATTPRLALHWNILTTPELPSVPFASVELLRSLSLLRVRACVHHPCRRVVRRRQGSVAKLTGSWCSGIWKPMREPTSDDVDDGLFQFHLCNTKEQSSPAYLSIALASSDQCGNKATP